MSTRLCLLFVILVCGAALAEPAMVTTESGLQYQDLVVGKGPQPQPGQVVIVHYKGWLLHGRMFDSSYAKGAPFAFVLGDREVIRGWEEGVATMRVGGKRRLIVPPSLGYRDEIVGTIPPDSTLVFEIVLLGVKERPASPPTP
jgi:FKBP-type peptidyl-prolyl cis-trans isomerase